MTRELYQVEAGEDGGKVVHYNGFLWHRDNADGETDGEGRPLDYACTEATFCYVPVAGNEGKLEEAVMAAFEGVTQYQDDICEERYLELMEEWGACPALHLDDVTRDTPVGLYHYDTGGID